MYTGVAAVEKWCLGMGDGVRMTGSMKEEAVRKRISCNF